MHHTSTARSHRGTAGWAFAYPGRGLHSQLVPACFHRGQSWGFHHGGTETRSGRDEKQIPMQRRSLPVLTSQNQISSPCFRASVVHPSSTTARKATTFLRAFVFLVGLVLLVGQASAIEVREVRWGFNGAIKRNAFNLCSIDFINPSPDPFIGMIELRPANGIGRGEDVPWVEDVYIAPGESRTIQFTPFVSSQAPDWRVKWGQASNQHFDFPHSNREIPDQVAVQFIALQGVSSPLRGIEAFLENDFPIGAAGTEVLGSVVLDHVPRWDEVRTRAFRDWLGRGGRLYLIQDRDGKPLKFPSGLDELNLPSDRFAVGQGVVMRQAIVHDAGEIPGLMTEVAKSATAANNPNNSYGMDPSLTGMTQLYQTMRNMVRPDHNWTLIFFLALIYLLILFPGIWLVSRQRGDFRITYALIVGTVLVFSWFYAEVGKRGYGESSGLRQMMVAYPLGNQRIALTKCCSLFVTDGGRYDILPHGEGAVFALDSATEFSGDAIVVNRPQAKIEADIPPFSACSFQESSVLPTQADYSIQLKTLVLSPKVQKIEVNLGAGIPATAQVYLVSGGNALLLSRNGTVWESPGTSQPTLLPISSMFPLEYSFGWGHLQPEQVNKNLLANLVQIGTSTYIQAQGAYSAPLNQNVTPESASAPFEAGQILVYCDAPAELLPSEYSASGKVLFVSNIDASMATTAATPPIP